MIRWDLIVTAGVAVGIACTFFWLMDVAHDIWQARKRDGK
jgi:hypothetical protein